MAYNPNQGYGAPGGYPPQQGGYPPQQGGYPPQQGGYPPQQGYGGAPGGYPPQQGYGGAPGGYPPQGQAQGYGAPQAQAGRGTSPAQAGRGASPGQAGRGQAGRGQAGRGGPPPQHMGAPAASSAAGASFNYQASNQMQQAWYYRYYQQQNQQQLHALRMWFQTVDTDRSGSISARELAQMKMPGQGAYGGRPIGFETARQLLMLFDRDRGGTLDFYEYAALHGFLNSMQQAFYMGDADRGGTLTSNEVYTAVKHAGFDLSQQSLQAYFYKFAGRPMGYGAYGQQAAMMGQHPGAGLHLDFLGFMKMAANIALAKSRFEWVDADRDGKIDLNEMLVIMAEFADPHGSAAAGAKMGKVGKAGKDAKKMKKGAYGQQAAMQGAQYGAQYGQEECVLQ